MPFAVVESIMFAALPLGFPKIEAFSCLANTSIPALPDLSSIGEKVYRVCIKTATMNLAAMRNSIQRCIPYAMWLDSKRDINSREDVVDWYYGKFNEDFLDGTSRTKRALVPLFHTYVARYDPSKKSFIRLAHNLQEIAKRCESRELQVLRLSALHKEFDFFNPQAVGERVANAYFANTTSLNVDRWFESIGMWSGFKNSSLGFHIYRCALLLPSSTFRDIQRIRLLMRWTKCYGKGLSADLKGLVAEALLRPWLDGDPPSEDKREIGDFCVAILGDPRFETFSWTKVSAEAKTMLLRWLTGRTLDAFFDILRNTADSIWKYRQDFWSWYYRQGHITEAWTVLGPDAHRYVLKNYRGADMAYGKLAGQYDEGQSVLLMRMGDLLFCEWSHNGKLRAIEIAAFDAPKLYQKSYDAADLRFDSLLFQSNTGHAHKGLPHLHSDRYWWQNTAAYFITRKIGVRR